MADVLLTGLNEELRKYGMTARRARMPEDTDLVVSYLFQPNEPGTGDGSDFASFPEGFANTFVDAVARGGEASRRWEKDLLTENNN